ncbi:hypothetical protein [Paeniglutamicibacter kerguelensis]|uniref:DUF4432 family protein n=1 Tax=Paeniglutamicibacter kerguelensis TaxID=254788 RepID=A0ABS4XAV7_9MICC|nr:hypothetical protein [Paeniglutamicibacter kerguelensis]MBP2385607.1 hypothetical protein [Paeniglutamicibacter kerguelensis]
MIVKIKDLKRILRRLESKVGRDLSNASEAGATLLRGQPANVIGLVYPDGKSVNVLVEKGENFRALDLVAVGLSPTSFVIQLEVVAETSTWIQFYGKIPEGTEEFEFKAKRGQRYVPVTDGTAGALGPGHLHGYRSWKRGAHWLAEFRSQKIIFVLKPDVNPVSVLGVSTGLGQISLKLGYSTAQETSLPNITLRARKHGKEIVVPVRSDAGQGLCIIDGASVAESVRGFPVGKFTWDLFANGERLQIGQTDIVNPRAVYRFGWIIAPSGTHCVKLRPYWTLDRKLSLEMKLTADLSALRIQ